MFDNGVKDEDIAILVWTNRDILKVEQFIKEVFNKDSITSSRAKVIHQQFAMAVINLMKYLYYKNSIYKFNFLSLIGEKWDNKKIDIPIMKPSQMVRFIMDKFELIDESTLRLLEHSFKYEELIDFVYDIDNFDKELPQKELKGVQILTIHKSKGLEFENVIILDNLGRKMSRNLDIIFDYDGVKLENLKVNFGGREFVDTDFKNVKQKEKSLEYEDNKNSEYVAFTRGKNSLFIIKKNKSSSFVTKLEPQIYGEFQCEKQIIEKEEIQKFNKQLQYYGKQNYDNIEEKVYKPNDFKAIYFGNATHYAFESECFNAVLNKYGEFCDVKKAFELYQESKKLLPNNGKIYKEYPFIYNGKVGIIDFMLESEKEILIIDYKTHTPNDEINYIKQINRYKVAMENLKQKATKGVIFYLDRMVMKVVE
jgi:exodeoxyribonuclease V beta subunit